jgi:hypothetical protein
MHTSAKATSQQPEINACSSAITAAMVSTRQQAICVGSAATHWPGTTTCEGSQLSWCKSTPHVNLLALASITRQPHTIPAQASQHMQAGKGSWLTTQQP